MLKLLRYLKAYVLTTLFFVKTFLVDCQCGVGTFLNRKVHNDVEPIFLDLGYWNIFKLKVILFCRYILKDQSIFKDWYESILDNMRLRLENQNISEDRLSLEVDTYQFDEIDSEKFFQEYLSKGKPVVVKRGSLYGEGLFSEESFLEYYGDANVSVSDMKTAKQATRTVREYLLDGNSDRVEYIRASFNFTLENPTFVEQLNPKQFDAYMCGTEAKNICYVNSELFLGNSKKTGSGFHCANGNNLFFMVRGQKKWVLVHPDYTWLMYPILNDPMRYILSEITPEVTSLPEAIDKIYPLWKYCPKQTVVLDPGDILLSPAWYWHTVDNVSDITIAMATRWLPIGKMTNRFLTLLQVFSQPSFQLLLDLLRTNSNSKVNDDNVLLATETIDERVAFGKTGQAKKIWDEKKQKAEQLLSPDTYRQYCSNIDPQYSENT